MKRKVTFMIVLITTFVLSTSCEKKYFSEPPITSIDTIGIQRLSVPIEKYYKVIKNKDYSYTIKLFNKNKKVVDQLTVPKEPYVNKLENGIIQVIISTGSPFYTTYFYDTKTNLISRPYDTPVLIEKEKIVFIENSNLIVSNIYNKDLFYKEVKRNFSQTVPPSSAIINAKFLDSDKLQIDYYEGENFREISEIIDLSKA